MIIGGGQRELSSCVESGAGSGCGSGAWTGVHVSVNARVAGPCRRRRSSGVARGTRRPARPALGRVEYPKSRTRKPITEALTYGGRTP